MDDASNTTAPQPEDNKKETEAPPPYSPPNGEFCQNPSPISYPPQIAPVTHQTVTQMIIVSPNGPCPSCQNPGSYCEYASCLYISVLVFLVLDFGIFAILARWCVPRPKRCRYCNYTDKQTGYIVALVLLILLFTGHIFIWVYVLAPLFRRSSSTSDDFNSRSFDYDSNYT